MTPSPETMIVGRFHISRAKAGDWWEAHPVDGGCSFPCHGGSLESSIAFAKWHSSKICAMRGAAVSLAALCILKWRYLKSKAMHSAYQLMRFYWFVHRSVRRFYWDIEHEVGKHAAL